MNKEKFKRKVKRYLASAEMGLKRWENKQSEKNTVEPNFYYFNGLVDCYNHILKIIDQLTPKKVR